MYILIWLNKSYKLKVNNMQHHYLHLENAEHYAIAPNCTKDKVLVQLGDKDGTQVRVILGLIEAQHMLRILQDAIEEVANPVKDWTR